MTARRALSQGAIIRVLIAQGAVIPCYRCRVALVAGDAVEREHIVPIALGGANDEGNCRFSHADCHAARTNGRKVGAERTATTAGSDKHAIAKTRRLTKAQEEARRRMLAKADGDAPAPTKWPKGRKLQSRNTFGRKG